ncbi:hypothetical protein EYF80_046629 [Liparis tanakae]|uniref:Uncharacterized protein n=1 Tax=Liparis tanakae TaxID=230148 RepID=A0A4Z2FS13_9TELE|nr:hypothetical protein EYF80_046629 [Liparis tanakae]
MKRRGGGGGGGGPLVDTSSGGSTFDVTCFCRPPETAAAVEARTRSAGRPFTGAEGTRVFQSVCLAPRRNCLKFDSRHVVNYFSKKKKKRKK